ncbi:hypothetical protein PVK06_009321 [Gossypium arboreum]|uniref:Uncharacterized protein n=1 Tax=Gossypium arboreum TaxID=29729 RepID=A0ABR0QM53_GOSAR|nr:hypothetical protein PVK06_009321 [Gossypium arboreum]
MAQGSGSASQAKFWVALLFCFLFFWENVDAATYTVGGSNGWTFNMATWPRGKRFRAGDTLCEHIHIRIKSVLKLHNCELGNLERYMTSFFFSSVRIRCNNPQCGGGEPGRLQKLHNAGGSKSV